MPGRSKTVQKNKVNAVKKVCKLFSPYLNESWTDEITVWTTINTSATLLNLLLWRRRRRGRRRNDSEKKEKKVWRCWDFWSCGCDVIKPQLPLLANNHRIPRQRYLQLTNPWPTLMLLPTQISFITILPLPHIKPTHLHIDSYNSGMVKKPQF